MDGNPRRRDARTNRPTRFALLIVAVALACALAPGSAGATVTEVTKQFQLPTVGGYAVKQEVKLPAPRPDIPGHIVEMSVDLVDHNGDPIPISRLMLHHIVFLNLGRQDQSCGSLTSFDNLTEGPAVQRFFAAGEERAKMKLPPGYGYDLSGNDYWGVLYMVMNHKPTAETDAYVKYTMKIDDDPSIQSVVPFWLDVNNCRADPIYNIRGTGDPGSESIRTGDFTLDQSKLGATGGRIVAGAGHVHGGAYRLELRQPSCDDRELFASTPTWGNPDHPFYNVLPVLHEPGPINMTAFRTPTGFPVEAGEPLRLNSVYDDSQPHTRVMGIMILYIAPDDSIGEGEGCGDLPTDIETLGTNEPGRTEPVPFTVPLTGLDDQGVAQTIKKPPGKTRRVKSGTTLKVGDNYFKSPNVKIDKGDKLTWAFDTSGLHNVTLANGPEAIGSPNLSRNGIIPREYSRRFRKPGTYRLFCALHPVQMTERVVVKK